MSTYICEKCGCIDNTACGGNYYVVVGKMNSYKDTYANEHLLCVECTPQEYKDGSINQEKGKWHNIFPKTHWSQIGSPDKLINECLKAQGNYVNAVEYFRNFSIEKTKRKVLLDGEFSVKTLYKCRTKWGTHGTNIAHFFKFPEIDKVYQAYKDDNFFDLYRVFVTGIDRSGLVRVDLI